MAALLDVAGPGLMTGDDTAFNDLMPRSIRLLPSRQMHPPGGDPRNMRKTPKRCPQIQMLKANGGKTDSTLVAGVNRRRDSTRIRAARRAAIPEKRGEIRLSLKWSVRSLFMVSRKKTQYVWVEKIIASTSSGACASSFWWCLAGWKRRAAECGYFEACVVGEISKATPPPPEPPP